MTISYNFNTTTHHLFQLCANESPAKIVVTDGTDALSYEEVEQKSNQLANYLIERGVTPDVPVGLCLERTVSVLVAMLGILKAGAAFMPLDTHTPELRLKTILSRSGANLVVTQQQLKGNFASFDGSTVLLDEDEEKISKYSSDAPHNTSNPDDLAYVIHTSGSTGEPKGVATEHSPLVNLILWHKKVLGDGGLKTLGFAPLTFDASVQEIFTTCCSGGTLFIVPEKLRLVPEKLAQVIADMEIERMIMAYTPLRYLMQAFQDYNLQLAKMKNIINVGEPLVITPVFRDFFQRHPQCELHNQYGLTETAVDMMDYKLEGDVTKWPERPPIGKPITNTKAYILNDAQQAVVSGEQGEIYVGGISIAREFLNQAELTREKFFPDPFSDIEHARMYRTGDMGKQLDDGNIQNLGRQDNQVKLRGFRIELDEIQTALLQHSGLKHAVALVIESVQGNKQLVAYLVGQEGKVPGVFELRTFLSRSLPEYMIPHAFVFLEKFPHTNSGKLDRKALPKPGKLASDTGYVAPVTEEQSDLVSIWQQVLNLERIGIADNFFVLGGDSLLAAQVLVRLEAEYAIDISLDSFYQAATISELSLIVNIKMAEQRKEQESALIALLDEIQGMTEEEVNAQLSDLE